MARLPFVITGASGRVGRLLQRAWAAVPPDGADLFWLSRQDWNIGHGPAPALPQGCVILDLAGITRGDLAANSGIAQAVAVQAAASGARHLFFASSAAVYQPSTDDLHEQSPPFAATPYGRAKRDAEIAVSEPFSARTTILRIGNIAGADALLGAAIAGVPVILDPVPGQTGGPVRSYIGPQALARVIARLVGLVAQGAELPQTLNVALPPAVAMAGLLQAAGLPWQYGPPNPAVAPRVSLDVARLAALIPLPATSAAAIVADWRSLQ